MYYEYVYVLWICIWIWNNKFFFILFQKEYTFFHFTFTFFQKHTIYYLEVPFKNCILVLKAWKRCSFQDTVRIIKNNIVHIPKVLHPPAGSGFLFMEIDITKVPFTSISRENWEMLMALDKDTLYSVIQTVGSYVLTGEKCECDSTLSRVVCG